MAASANDSKADRDRQTLLWTRRLAIWTGGLALATFVSTAFVGVDLWLKNTEQKHTELQLGAYLTLAGGTIVHAVDAKTGKAGPAFFPAIQNLGGTRTASTKAWASVKYFEGGVPNNIDFSKPYNAVAENNTILGPQGILPFMPIGITDAEVDDAREGKGVILVWGVATYATIYHPDEYHHLRFCLVMNAVKPPPAPFAAITQQLAQTYNFSTQAYRADCNQGD